jgi:hypothetical protein
MQVNHVSWAAAVAVLALGACSSTPPPREELAASRATVSRASGSAAAEAPVELAAARAKIEQANVAMANKDYKAARQLAEQAEADVSLAEARAQLSRTDSQLMEVRESIRLLRQQAPVQP